MGDMPCVWQDWEIGELLDSGSSGAVYRAWHRNNPGLQAAVKVIDIPPDPSWVEELRAAGRTEEQIHHYFERVIQQTGEEINRMCKYKGSLHIVNLEDFRAVPHEDGIGATVYIRMELLKSLPVYLSDKHLSEEEVITAGIGLCEALEECHPDGLLHRDIKPENIFVNDRLPSGILYKLGDFGSAEKILSPREERDRQGTLNYMAPEAASGQACDERSDLYSLGLTLYQLMNANRLPFLPEKQFCNHAEKSVALQTRLSGAPLPDPAEASPAFTEVLKKACATKPENRYQSAAEMKAALQSLQQPSPLKEKSEPVRPEKRSNRLRNALLAFLALLCLLLGTQLLWQRKAGNDSSAMEALPTKIPLLPVIERRTDAP